MQKTKDLIWTSGNENLEKFIIKLGVNINAFKT